MLNVDAAAELARPLPAFQLSGDMSGLLRGISEDCNLLDPLFIGLLIAYRVALLFEDFDKCGEGRPGRNVCRPVIGSTRVGRPPAGSVSESPGDAVVVRILRTGDAIGPLFQSRDLCLDPFLNRQSTNPRLRPHSSQALAASL